MTAILPAALLAHAGHVAPHGGTEGFIGVALLLIGAVAALWLTSRSDSRRTGQHDDSRRPGRDPSDTHRPCDPAAVAIQEQRRNVHLQ
jgi:hypothetical protein